MKEKLHGSQFAAARIISGETVAAICKAAGVGPNTLNRVERAGWLTVGETKARRTRGVFTRAMIDRLLAFYSDRHIELVTVKGRPGVVFTPESETEK